MFGSSVTFLFTQHDSRQTVNFFYISLTYFLVFRGYRINQRFSTFLALTVSKFLAIIPTFLFTSHVPVILLFAPLHFFYF